MDEGFSGVVRLSSVDDFIAPSQNCIIPLTTFAKSTQPPLVSISAKTKTLPSTKKVQISLSDCLACSGCVTTAETVLVDQQSGTRLLQVLEQKAGKMNVVVTVAPQSVVSIAAIRDQTVEDAASSIQNRLLEHGVDYVLDSSFARSLSLLASFDEFSQLFLSPSCSSRMPLLSSSCPGWICYAEKTHGSLLTPLLSRVRSAQAVSGSLVKNYLAQCLGSDLTHEYFAKIQMSLFATHPDIAPDNIFHTAVMPCFDKKLEASRDDFLVPGTNVRQVDCVISTAELLALLDAWSATSSIDDTRSSFDSIDRPKWLSLVDANGNLLGHGGGYSGGYCDYILNRSIKDIFHLERHQVDISRTRRNKDLEEIVLTSEGSTLLRVGKAYGFRNIQNLVQKLKRDKCNLKFIEVMACPGGGCTNGGGQLRAETVDMRRECLNKVNQLFDTIPETDPELNSECNTVLKQWLGTLHSDKAKQFLYTDYHPIDTVIQPPIKW